MFANIKKQPWYIWLSFFGFAFLVLQSGWRIIHREYGISNIWNLLSRLFFHFALWTVVIPVIVNVLIVEHITYSVVHLESRLVSILLLIVYYLYFVFVSYMQLKWREKHISHFGLEYSVSRIIESMEDHEDITATDEQRASARHEDSLVAEEEHASFKESAKAGYISNEEYVYRSEVLHSETYGAKIASFNTKLSSLFLRRIWGVIIPLGVFIFFVANFISYVNRVFTSTWMIERGNNNWSTVLDMLLVEYSFAFIPLLALITYGLFFRKTYSANVHEGGLVLMLRGRGKDRFLSYDEIRSIDEITYKYEKYFITVYQRRVVQIKVKYEKRPIRITAANMAKFIEFHDVASEALDSYHANKKENN